MAAITPTQTSTNNHRHVLAITAGEPSGIGPDVTITAIQQAWSMPLVVIADQSLLECRAAQLNLAIRLHPYQPSQNLTPLPAGEAYIEHTPLIEPVVCGQLNVPNGRYVLNGLQRAAEGCLSGEFSAVITAPVNKAVINDAGIPFSGHTEYFAEQANCKKVVMMLVAPQLRVALVTTHLPLRDVADAITKQEVESTLRILYTDMQQKFAIKQPKILIAGLNPHAGESGHLGNEEINIIDPVIQSLQQEGFDLVGSLPADTLFTPPYLEQADACVAMYHDQGLSVLKCLGFGQSINVTLGLPFIRTSVDHGTALDLAGTGKAKASSMIYAIEAAQNMLQAQLAQSR